MSRDISSFGKISYEYALGVLSVSPHSPLKKEQWSRVKDASANELLRLLPELGYPAGTIQEAVSSELTAVKELLKSISPQPELTDAMFFEEDALNLKLYLKAALSGDNKEINPEAGGRFDPETLRLSVLAGDWSLLDEKTAALLEGVQNETNPFLLSCRVDNAMLLSSIATAKRYFCKPLENFLLEYGAGRNRLTIKRIEKLGLDPDFYKAALLPVAATAVNDTGKTYSELDSEITKQLLSVLEQAGYSDGMGRFVQFYFMKKLEASQLRLLYTEKSLIKK